MFPDVKLKSIEFKDFWDTKLASVKVNLSNEYSSEVYEQQGGSYGSTETIEYDPNLRVTAVKAYYHWRDGIYSMKFLDDSDSEIYDWNTDIMHWPQSDQDVKYGYIDKYYLDDD